MKFLPFTSLSGESVAQWFVNHWRGVCILLLIFIAFCFGVWVGWDMSTARFEDMSRAMLGKVRIQ